MKRRSQSILWLLITLLTAGGLTTRAVVFNLTYDTSVTSLTNALQVENAFNTATAYLQSLYTNNINIAITVYWGATGPFSSGIGLGASSTSYIGTTTYAQLTNYLRNARSTSEASNAVASLPASDPTGGNTWWYPRAEAKALGYIANDTSQDGSIGFASTVSYTFDPTNRLVSGKFDFIGVALHEITEVMGRVYYDLSTIFIPYDLYRFSGPGTRVINTTAPSVYFSVDNGTNVLRFFNPVEANGDLTDWAVSGPADSFDYSVSAGKKTLLSYADLVSLNVLGYKLSYSRPILKLTTLAVTNRVVSYTSTPGSTFTILATSNLALPMASWTNLGTNTDTASPGQFFFTNAASTNLLRYYRARLN